MSSGSDEWVGKCLLRNVSTYHSLALNFYFILYIYMPDCLHKLWIEGFWINIDFMVRGPTWSYSRSFASFALSPFALHQPSMAQHNSMLTVLTFSVHVYFRYCRKSLLTIHIGILRLWHARKHRHWTFVRTERKNINTNFNNGAANKLDTIFCVRE